MKWFYNMKISAKLIIGFIIVAIISGVIGVVGIFYIKKINDNDTLLYETNTVPISQLAEIAELFQRQRISLYEIILLPNVEDKKKEVENIEGKDKEIENLCTEYEKLINDDEERALFDEYKKAVDSYLPYREKIITLALGKNEAQAIIEIQSEALDTARTAVQDGVSNLKSKNIEDAKKRSIDNDAAANQAEIVMIALISIGMLLAVLLGLFISRAISNPIKKLVEASNKISNGDLEVNMNINSKDEVGILAKAFEKVIEALKSLISDSKMLTQAALDGKLSTRADAGRHNGDYRTIIEGVNNTLDAVIAPINEALSVIEEMSKGNLQLKVKGDYMGDQAKLKNGLNETINSLSSYVSEISDVLTEMAEGNLDVSITADYKGDFVEIKNSLNNIIQGLNDAFSEINNAADQVASGANQVSDGSQELSQGSTEQASSIEELTASIEEIAAQTKQNAVNANQANEFASNAKNNAVKGNEQMKQMLNSMTEINEASENIYKIIKVIDDIAFQTNILALNAAVEAARAGQHGKGFAVVAEEVRNLAARSANAAKETTSLIEGTINKVEAGTKIANNTAEALTSIVEEVNKAAVLVGEIAVASNEQATGVAQINKGIEQVSQVVQNNSATSEESASASEELSSQADMLKEMVSKFKLKKSNRNRSQYELEDVIKDSNGMQRRSKGEKNKKLTAAEVETSIKPRIALSDEEFGKY